MNSILYHTIELNLLVSALNNIKSPTIPAIFKQAKNPCKIPFASPPKDIRLSCEEIKTKQILTFSSNLRKVLKHQSKFAIFSMQHCIKFNWNILWSCEKSCKFSEIKNKNFPQVFSANFIDFPTLCSCAHKSKQIHRALSQLSIVRSTRSKTSKSTWRQPKISDGLLACLRTHVLFSVLCIVSLKFSHFPSALLVESRHRRQTTAKILFTLSFSLLSSFVYFRPEFFVFCRIFLAKIIMFFLVIQFFFCCTITKRRVPRDNFSVQWKVS